MGNLALTYSNQGRLDEAQELQSKELAIWANMLGAEYPDTLISMYNLASIFTAQARNQEALLLIRECYELRNQILGAKDPNTRSSYKT